MTNGEKMQAVFPDIEMWGESKDTLDYSLGGMIHRVTKSWWNAEYKEPTIKNDLSSGLEKNSKELENPTTKKDLGVEDCVSRVEVLKLMRDNWHTHNGDWAMQESIDDIRALPSVTPQEPRWIPVSEKLPEDDKDVLIFTIAESIYKACHSLKDWSDDHYEWFVMGTLGWSLTYEEDEVLAWMPLPKPYEPQESEDT